MNQSERLHNQGDNEQLTTPELMLSMELWNTCVKLLDEKGQNKIRVEEIASRVLFPPFILFNILYSLELPYNNLRYRYVHLKGANGDNKEGETLISMYGVNPNKAKEIRVYARRLMEETSPDLTFLRLRKNKRAEIKVIGHDSLLLYSVPCYADVKIGKAKMQDLEAYQRYIQQGSPVEHK